VLVKRRYRVECLNPACAWVGYRSPHPLNDCACYSEYAYYCRPETPGPGCPNGANLRARCPRCKSDWEPRGLKSWGGPEYFIVRKTWTREFAAEIQRGRAKLRREGQAV
jgi:hypothetical protein